MWRLTTVHQEAVSKFLETVFAEGREDGVVTP